MGNVRSVFLCRDNDVDWDNYVSEEWRSERVRDLDKLGGAQICVLLCHLHAANRASLATAALTGTPASSWGFSHRPGPASNPQVGISVHRYA